MTSGKFAAVVLVAAAASLVPAAFGQAWPAKTVRIIVPFAPGGSTDIQARLLAKKYYESMGQPFVVENRAGASGMIGTEAVVRAPADGYTQLFTSSSLSVNTTLFASRIKFDPLQDLAPVTWLSSVPLLLTIHPGVPVKSVRELVTLSKRQKNGLNGGHNGSGTTSHIALEMFVQQAGANLVAIPYKGGGPATTAILAGEIDLTFSTLTTVKPHVESGRLRALAVTTRTRSGIFPELPTMDSLYADFESDNWFGLFVATGTPKEIIGKLHAAALDALKSAEMRDFILKDGGDPVGSTPDELASHLRREVARYAKVIKAGNIKVD